MTAMLLKWPLKYILIGKIDLDDAYRRIHKKKENPINIHSDHIKIAFLCLKLPFGTTPAPEDYTTIRNIALDLINDLLMKKMGCVITTVSTEALNPQG